MELQRFVAACLRLDSANGDNGDYDRPAGPLELDLGRAEVKGQRRGKGIDPTSTRSAG